MRPAHVNLLLSLSLVHEAIGKVAEKIPAALSTDSATAVPAVRGIAGEMRAFDAADVVYNRRTAALIKQVLDDNDIGGQVIQSSSFLQNLGWMQPSTVARRINSQAGRGAGDGASTEAAPGTHGHGLIAVSVGDLTLEPGGSNRLPAASSVTFNVKVANQGENPEQDVRVRVRISGAGDPKRADEVIDQTAGGDRDDGRAQARRPADRAADDDPRRGPAGQRREEHREQHAELPGDLRARLIRSRRPDTALPFGRAWVTS